MISSIVKTILYLLFMGIAWFLTTRWGWWKDSRMKWTRLIVIILICTILSNAVFDIVKKKFWNNSQEENVVETQTKLVGER